MRIIVIKKAQNTMGASNNDYIHVDNKNKGKKNGGNRMRHRRSTKVVRGLLTFLSRRDRDFQKFIFIKLRPT